MRGQTARRYRCDGLLARLHGIVIDCPDPDALATCYQELPGMIRVQDDGDWVVIGDSPDRPGVAFARRISRRRLGQTPTSSSRCISTC